MKFEKDPQKVLDTMDPHILIQKEDPVRGNNVINERNILINNPENNGIPIDLLPPPRKKGLLHYFQCC